MSYPNKVLIIAEAGVNHNGDLDLAKQLIEVAAAAGADYVKFQTFKAALVVSSKAVKADYQKVNTGDAVESQLDMVRKLELKEEMHYELIGHCEAHNIGFLSTGFDHPSLDFLNGLGMDFFKIPSGEIVNALYLKHVASFGKPIVLSTGMCNLAEIENALEVLEANGIDRQQIIVLHCNTEYPTPMEDVNLRAMQAIGSAFDVRVGYSDHTNGIEVPIAAVALGAVCIEKHFTLDRRMEGPDHAASLEPEELRQMVQSIRNIEIALGSTVKRPSPSETKNKAIARKSIFLRHDVSAGHVLKEDDIIMMRPGDGISPMEWLKIEGKTTRHALPAEHKLQYADFE